MTTLAELQADVYTLTNRPDLVSETLYCIKKATLRLHQLEEFPKDLVEVPVTGLVTTSTVDNRYSIDVTAAPFLRYRKPVYVRDNPTPVAGAIVNQFSLIPADVIMNNYNQEFSNYWYEAGNNIQIRAFYATTSVKVGYYRNPDVATATYSSWIADLYSNAVSDDAAAQLFKLIGKDDEYTRFTQISADNFRIIQMSQIH
jgi:hypothetical protein